MHEKYQNALEKRQQTISNLKAKIEKLWSFLPVSVEHQSTFFVQHCGYKLTTLKAVSLEHFILVQKALGFLAYKVALHFLVRSEVSMMHLFSD